MCKKVGIFTYKLNISEIKVNFINFLHDGGDSIFEIVTEG